MAGLLRSTPWRWRVATGAVVWALATTSPAWAQVATDAETKAEARQNAIDGQKAFDMGDYATAARRLGLAYEAMAVPTVGVRYARALVQIGQLRKAAGIYRQVLAFDSSGAAVDPALQAQAQAEARQELPALQERIPVLVLQLRAAVPADREGVEISIDDRVLVPEAWSSVPLNPGTHTVQVRRKGQVIAAEKVSLQEAERRTVVLSVPPAQADPAAAPMSPSDAPGRGGRQAPPAPDDDSTRLSSGPGRTVLTWTALGVGAAGLLVGGVTGGIVLAKKSQLDGSGDCEGSGRDTECSPSSTLDTYNHLRPVSTVGFVVGFVGAGIGTTLLLTQPSRGRRQIEARLGPGSFELVGRFR